MSSLLLNLVLDIVLYHEFFDATFTFLIQNAHNSFL